MRKQDKEVWYNLNIAIEHTQLKKLIEGNTGGLAKFFYQCPDLNQEAQFILLRYVTAVIQGEIHNNNEEYPKLPFLQIGDNWQN